MDIYVRAIQQAIGYLTAGDPYVVSVVTTSLITSGSAVIIATLIGLPIGYALGMSRFAGRGIILIFVNTAMGFPPVVVGLFVYMALSRSGPLAGLHWLYSVPGMILGQVLLAAPLVVGVSTAAIASVPRDLRLQLRALGASRLQESFAVFREVRTSVIVAIIAGFGAIISEVGAVAIIGGGIEGETDVMTTAIMANVNRGDNSRAMAWALILISIALFVNIVLTTMQNRGARHER